MKKKKFYKLMIISGSFLLVLTTILVVHIYLVTKKPVDEPAVHQLSRIDFKQPIDSAEANRIKGFIAKLEGIENSYFNVKDGILVYTYTVGKQTSNHVYEELIKFGNYEAERYVVSASDLKTGCPMRIEKQSITYQISSYISNFFNDKKTQSKI